MGWTLQFWGKYRLTFNFISKVIVNLVCTWGKITIRQSMSFLFQTGKALEYFKNLGGRKKHQAKTNQIHNYHSCKLMLI